MLNKFLRIVCAFALAFSMVTIAPSQADAQQFRGPTNSAYNSQTATGATDNPYKILVTDSSDFVAPSAFWSGSGVTGAGGQYAVNPFAVSFEQREGNTSDGKLISAMAFDMNTSLHENVPTCGLKLDETTAVWDLENPTWTYAFRLAVSSAQDTSTGDLRIAFAWHGCFATYFDDWDYSFDAVSATAGLDASKQLAAGDEVTLTYYGAYDVNQTSRGTSYGMDFSNTTTNNVASTGEALGDPEGFAVTAVVGDDGFVHFNGDNSIKYGGNYTLEKVQPSQPTSWDVSAAEDGSVTASLVDNGDGTNTLSFAGTGAMKDYQSADAVPWAASASTVTAAVFGDGVTNVGSYALGSLANLKMVRGGNTLSTLDANAFASSFAIASMDFTSCTLDTVNAQAFGGQQKSWANRTIYLADAASATAMETVSSGVINKMALVVANGGSIPSDVDTTTAGTLASSLERDDYEFAGYFTDADCSTPASGWVAWGKATVIYAGWTEVSGAKVYKQEDGYEPYQGWQDAQWDESTDPDYSSQGGTSRKGWPAWSLEDPLSIGVTAADASKNLITGDSVKVVTDVNATKTGALETSSYENPWYYKNIILDPYDISGSSISFTFNTVNPGGAGLSGDKVLKLGGFAVTTSDDPTAWGDSSNVVWTAQAADLSIEQVRDNWWQRIKVTVPTENLQDGQTYYFVIKNGTAGGWGRIYANIVFQFTAGSGDSSTWSGDLSAAGYGREQGNGGTKLGFTTPDSTDLVTDLTKAGECFYNIKRSSVELGDDGAASFVFHADGSGSNWQTLAGTWSASGTQIKLINVYDSDPMATDSFSVDGLTPVASSELGNLTLSLVNTERDWPTRDGLNLNLKGLSAGKTYYVVFDKSLKPQTTNSLGEPIVLKFTTAGEDPFATLASVISDAQSDLDTTEVAKDASEVSPEKQWVTQEAHDALADAIKRASSVKDNASASKSDIADAVTALKQAKEAFDAAKSVGTMREVVAKWEIGKTNAADLVATLYADGALEFSGTGDANGSTPWTESDYVAKVKSVTFGVGVSISSMNGYFSNCANLETVGDLPSTVESLGNAFKGCASLKSIGELSASLTDMEYAFSYCSSLTEIPEIPSGVTDMQGAFAGCTALAAAPVLPSGVVDVSCAFQDCTSLKTAPALPETATKVATMFKGCTSLVDAPVIPDGVSDMKEMFSGCTSLESAPSIPDGVTSLNSAFYGDTALDSISAIPVGVTDLANAFANCPKLTKLPDGFTVPSAAGDTAKSAFKLGDPYSADNLLTTTIDEPVDESVSNYDWTSCYRTLKVNKTYVISNADELKQLSDDVASGNTFAGDTFVLADDVDLSSIQSWNPIGSSSTKFCGVFDGKGHTISHLDISGDQQYSGLFGFVSGGAVRNVTLTDSVVANNRQSFNAVGSLVGYAADGAVVENCSSSAQVSNSAPSGTNVIVGGVVGYLYSGASATNLEFTGSVSGSYDVAGVVGYAHSAGAISRCRNLGSVKFTGDGGYGNVAGIVGQVYGSDIVVSECYNSGSVTSGYSDCTAGVVGFAGMGARIVDCYNAGEISAWGNALAGVVGYISQGSVVNVYNAGIVTRASYDSYAAGVTLRTGAVIAGMNSGVTGNQNLYYLDSSIDAENAGTFATSKTAEQMKEAATFAGFDFAATWQIGAEEGYDYPTLVANYNGQSTPVETSWDVSAAQDGSIIASVAKLDDGTYRLAFEGAGSMRDYASASDVPWAAFSELISSAVIGDGITNVGSYALGAQGLQTVYGGSDVAVIDSNAFTGAVSLVAADLSGCTLTSVAADSFGSDASVANRTVYVKDSDSASACKAYTAAAASSTAIAVLNGSAFAEDVVFEAGTLATPELEGYTFVTWTSDAELMHPAAAWKPMTDYMLYAKFSEDQKPAEPVVYPGSQGLDQQVRLLDVSKLPTAVTASDVLFYGEDDTHYDNRFQTTFNGNQTIEFAYQMSRGSNANGGNGAYQLSFTLPYISVLNEDGEVVATYDNGNGALKHYGTVFDGTEGKTTGYTITAVKIGLDAKTLPAGTYTLRFSKDFGANNGISFLGKNVDFQFSVAYPEQYKLVYSYDSSSMTAQVVGYESLDDAAVDLVVPETVTDPATGSQYRVTAVAAHAFDPSSQQPVSSGSIASVELPASVTSIGDAAFANMPALESVKVLAKSDASIPSWGTGVFTGSANSTLYGYMASSAMDAAKAYDNVTFAPLDDGIYVNNVAVSSGDTVELSKGNPIANIVVVRDGELVTSEYCGYITNTNVASHPSTSAYDWNTVTGQANGSADLQIKSVSGELLATLSLKVTGFDNDAVVDAQPLSGSQGNGATVQLQGKGDITTVDYDETCDYFDNYVSTPVSAAAASFQLSVGGPGSAWGPGHSGWQWDKYLTNAEKSVWIEDADGNKVATMGNGLYWIKQNATAPLIIGVDRNVLTPGKTYVLVADSTFTGHNVSASLMKAVHWTFTAAATNISDLSVGDIADQTQVEEGCKPELTVTQLGVETNVLSHDEVDVKSKTDDYVLVPGIDYDVAYVNNTAAGEATAIITGKGNYAGTVEKKFTIVSHDASGLKKAIADAAAAVAGVVAADSDDELQDGVQWASQSAIDAMNKVISDAANVANNEDATQADYDAALAALAEARTKFFADEVSVAVVGTTELSSAIDAAQGNLDATKVASDASQVLLDEKWVSKSDADNYAKAIAAAKTALNSDSKTKASVAAALKALNEATATFDAAKQDGIGSPETPGAPGSSTAPGDSNDDQASVNAQVGAGAFASTGDSADFAPAVLAAFVSLVCTVYALRRRNQY